MRSPPNGNPLQLPLDASESKTASTAAALPNRWWALALISLAILMVGMDTAIVAVALPSAQRDLGISDSARQWVLTAYTLSYGGLLLLGGRLADRLGHRRTLLIGAIGFVCSSALSGAAISGPMLFAGRALQGGFGALLVPSTRSLLVLIFHDPKERARALGIFTAVLIGGAVFGFILSGVITNYLDWRWTLYVNVPVAVVVALGVLRLLPDFPGDPSVRIDLPGVLLGTGGMVALVFGLSQAATSGWGSAEVAYPLIAAVALLGAFVLVEARVASPLLPLRVLADRNRAGAFITLGLNSFSNFGMLLILTYELQVVLHASPLATGVALVPWAIAAAIGAAFVGPRLMNRLPARYLLTPGLLLLSVGLLLADTAHTRHDLCPADSRRGAGARLRGGPQRHAGHLHGTERHPYCRHGRDLGDVEHLEPDRRLDWNSRAEHDCRRCHDVVSGHARRSFRDDRDCPWLRYGHDCRRSGPVCGRAAGRASRQHGPSARSQFRIPG